MDNITLPPLIRDSLLVQRITQPPPTSSPLSRLRIRHDILFSYISSTTDHSPLLPFIDLAYTVIGNGPQYIVFIPGMCTPHTMWHHQVEQLQATSRYTILLFDNRGSGDSTIPIMKDGSNAAGYDMTTMARDVWAIVDIVLGRHVCPHFVGHSMGSMIAQRATLIAPSRVASLTLLSGHAGGWFWNWIPPPALLCAGIELIRSGFDPHIAAEIYMRLHYTQQFLDGWTVEETSGLKVQRRSVLYKRYLDGILRDRNKDKEGNGFWGQLAAVRSHSLSKDDANRLKQLRIPKLVMFGERDGVVLPRGSKELAYRIGAQVLGVRGSHFITEESAHDVNRFLILQFERATPMQKKYHGFFCSLPYFPWTWDSPEDTNIALTDCSMKKKKELIESM